MFYFFISCCSCLNVLSLTTRSCLICPKIYSISGAILFNSFIILCYFKDNNSYSNLRLFLQQIMNVIKRGEQEYRHGSRYPNTGQLQNHGFSVFSETKANRIVKDAQKEQGYTLAEDPAPTISHQPLVTTTVNRFSSKNQMVQNSQISRHSENLSQKLGRLQKENQILQELKKNLQSENLKLSIKNKELETSISQILFILKSEFRGHDSEIQLRHQQQSHQRLEKNTMTGTDGSFDYMAHCTKLESVIDSLQQQNLLLTQFKVKCLQKIQNLEQSIHELKLVRINQMQKDEKKTQRLLELQRAHAEDRRIIENLQKKAQESNEQLLKVVKEAKIRDEQMQYAHQKFHREMQKMKERLEKQKKKGQGYRKERDELALEIQKAKLEIGTVTLRKYFPDSDD